MAVLEAKPGAVSRPIAAPRASSPNALIYYVCGKIFAILSVRGDVPAKEVKRLVAHSYELVCAGLTRKQQAELAGSTTRAEKSTKAKRGKHLGR
jgi:hypothetical protein